LLLAKNIFDLLFEVLQLFKWALILAAIFSTLISFGVLDSRNRVVWTISDFLYRVTDPALRPIRRVMPSFSGIDLSPLVALLLIQYVVQPLILQIEISLGIPLF
jgi:YggT family protein